jgi:hypothetical protein
MVIESCYRRFIKFLNCVVGLHCFKLSVSYCLQPQGLGWAGKRERERERHRRKRSAKKRKTKKQKGKTGSETCENEKKEELVIGKEREAIIIQSRGKRSERDSSPSAQTSAMIH